MAEMFNSDAHKPLSQIELLAGLRQLGLEPGQIVEVHSSLSSFGPVEGGPTAVVDALMDIIGPEGSIIMSAYPVSKLLPLSEEEKKLGILAKARVYDDDYTGPTGMGAVADEFRHRPNTILSASPHRVCAWGKHAHELSQGYDVFLEMNGWALLLGVDIRRCSSMHQAEKYPLPAEITQRFTVPDEILRRYPEDIYLCYGQLAEESWLQIQTEAERRGLVKIGQIGRATCRFFRAKPVVSMYEEALRTDPLTFYGMTKPSN